jgi:hypothetical protein
MLRFDSNRVHGRKYIYSITMKQHAPFTVKLLPWPTSMQVTHIHCRTSISFGFGEEQYFSARRTSGPCQLATRHVSTHLLHGAPGVPAGFQYGRHFLPPHPVTRAPNYHGAFQNHPLLNLRLKAAILQNSNCTTTYIYSADSYRPAQSLRTGPSQQPESSPSGGSATSRTHRTRRNSRHSSR